MSRQMLCPYTGKIVYFTRAAARRVAARIFSQEQKYMKIYRCKDCKQLHLASIKRREK